MDEHLSREAKYYILLWNFWSNQILAALQSLPFNLSLKLNFIPYILNTIHYKAMLKVNCIPEACKVENEPSKEESAQELNTVAK